MRNSASACMCIVAITRDIITLTKQPDLRKRWIDVILKYIRENYINDQPVPVHAIVGPDTKGNVLAVAVALELHLPYIPIRKAGKIAADPHDLHETTYKNRNDKVNLLLEMH